MNSRRGGLAIGENLQYKTCIEQSRRKVVQLRHIYPGTNNIVQCGKLDFNQCCGSGSELFGRIQFLIINLDPDSNPTINLK